MQVSLIDCSADYHVSQPVRNTQANTAESAAMVYRADRDEHYRSDKVNIPRKKAGRKV